MGEPVPGLNIGVWACSIESKKSVKDFGAAEAPAGCEGVGAEEEEGGAEEEAFALGVEGFEAMGKEAISRRFRGRRETETYREAFLRLQFAYSPCTLHGSARSLDR